MDNIEIIKVKSKIDNLFIKLYPNNIIHPDYIDFYKKVDMVLDKLNNL